MALSGSSSTLQIPVIGCQFYFTWSATQSIENNTSTVTVIVYSARYSSGGWFTGTKNKNSYSVAGTASGVLTANGVPQGSTQYQWIEQSRWTTTVAHNSDGTKTGVVISARIYQAPSPTYDQTISVTIDLDTIPRATEITTFPNFTVTATTPTTMSVTLSRKATTFTHNITLTVNGVNVATWAGVSWNGASTLTLSSTHRTNILNAIPSAMSATMTLTVVTKSSSGTTIGTKTKNATCSISTTIKPSISGISITTNTPIGAISGISRSYAIRNVSDISVNYSSIPGLGSTVVDAYAKIGSTIIRSVPAIGKPVTSGNVPIQIYVKDKRNQSTTYDSTVSVIDYVPVMAQAQYIGRPLSGTDNRLTVTLNLSVSDIKYGSPLIATNKYNVTIKATPIGGGTTITSVNETLSGGTTNQTKTYSPTNNHDVTKSFAVTITIKDDFSTVNIVGSLSTAAHPFVLGDIGVGVGGIPQPGRVLDVYDPVNNGIFVNNDLWIGGIYETGSNANGTYTKFTNGLMICMAVKTINTNDFVELNDTTYVTAGSPFMYSRIESQPMPAAFTECFYQNATVNGSSLVQARSREIFIKMAWGSSLDYINKTLWHQPAIYHCGALSANGTITFSFFAIGLWK